mmetsp:Transcript_7564/g.8660  ORF Transcript_7564/g.8660 Transcript_7564/m.8660 type:complete len:297 (+) Transcript_7564:203-1093(+)
MGLILMLQLHCIKYKIQILIHHWHPMHLNIVKGVVIGVVVVTRNFKPYTFEWTNPNSNPETKILQHINNYKKKKNDNGNHKIGDNNSTSSTSPNNNTSSTSTSDRTVVCFAGQSHSRVMHEHTAYWLDYFNISNTTIIPYHLALNYPRDLRARYAMRKAKNWCNITLAGFGQWSAGREPRKVIPATPLPEYYLEYETSIKAYLQHNISLMIRKTHYNPLGDLKNTCPPTDWRNPPAIDGYNEITRTLAKKYNISYLDSGFIMDTMWDSASDYCHYKGLEGRIEALYYLEKILARIW